ncbi:MAG: SHOCT domain-containing protein [Dehalococcoidales bacterium]|nr:SHOCT domain-containing protein [Dehalococcoidales bacterium]
MMWDNSIGLVWLFNLFIMVVFWGGILALVIWLIIKLARGGSSITRSNNALDIAKERYAKGEISREEFEQIKKDLT